MRHQRQRYQLSRSASHRKALLKNLAKEVIDHERIQTTEAKAKAVKPEVEKLITLAKRGDLHARRQALSALGQDKFVVYKLFEEIAPRYTERPGGYTRILKLGPRRSDYAAADRIRRKRLRRLGAAGRSAHRPRGTRARTGRRPAPGRGAADGGRPDRRGRPRLGSGGQL